VKTLTILKYQGKQSKIYGRKTDYAPLYRDSLLKSKSMGNYLGLIELGLRSSALYEHDDAIGHL